MYPSVYDCFIAFFKYSKYDFMIRIFLFPAFRQHVAGLIKYGLRFIEKK